MSTIRKNQVGTKVGDNETATFFTLDGKFRFLAVLGSSAKISVSPSTNWVSEFYVAQDKSEKKANADLDIVLLKANDGRGDTSCGIVLIDWKNQDEPIGIGKTFTPPFADRLPRILYDGVEVIAEDELFTTDLKSPTAKECKSVWQVNAQDVLKYVLGHTDLGQLREVAIIHVEEAAAREQLPQVQTELAQAKQEIRSLETNLVTAQELQKRVRELLQEVDEKEKALKLQQEVNESLETECDTWCIHARDFHNLLSSFRVLTWLPSIKEALVKYSGNMNNVKIARLQKLSQARIPKR